MGGCLSIMYTDVYLLCTGMHLIQFYLARQGATEHFPTKPPEKNRAREPLLVLGAWVTEGSQEAVQVTLPPLMMARRSSVSDPCCPWLGPRVARAGRLSGTISRHRADLLVSH